MATLQMILKHALHIETEKDSIMKECKCRNPPSKSIQQQFNMNNSKFYGKMAGTTH